MATTAFICAMGDSEESVRSLQLKQRGYSYTLLQVLVGVLAVLVLAMTGGIIWMKISQNCPERYCPERYCLESDWTMGFKRNTLIETGFILPRSGEYKIRGNISIKSTNNDCIKSFQLFEKLVNGTERRILQQLSNLEVIKTVNLEEGSGLRIKLNCPELLEIDEEKSYLKVYQKTCS